MTDQITIISAAKCPRCGYDLRGTVATWTRQCPLAGTCTECGLSLPWAEVLSAKVRKPRWCVEYAERWRHIPWRSVRTIGMTFWPWGFWQSLRMTHPIQYTRLFAYVGVLVALGYVFFCLGHAGVALGTWFYFGAWASTNVNPVTVVLHAMVLPFGGHSPGVVVYAGGQWSFPSPIQLLHAWAFAAQVWCLYGLMFVICPLSFIALRQSCHLAKVRFVHIVRVAIYVVPWLVVHVLLVAGFLTISESRGVLLGDTVVRWYALFGEGFGYGLIGVQFLWWYAATKHYLRMTHSWAVAVSVTMVGLLGASAAMYLLHPEFLIELLQEWFNDIYT